MPFLEKTTLDARIALFALLTSLLCAAIFGLAPALHKNSPQALAASTRMTAPQAVLRQFLVIAQIAGSMVLLAGGALLMRSFWSLQNQGLGLNPESVVTARHIARPKRISHARTSDWPSSSSWSGT